jgi:hypothetical protein
MKGAKAFVVSSSFLQFDILTNNANDICRLSNLSNNVLGDVPGQKALHNRKGKIGTRRQSSCATSLIAAFSGISQHQNCPRIIRLSGTKIH